MTRILMMLTFCFSLISSAQSSMNMQLIAEKSYNVDINDIWAYVAPNGDEFALVGMQNGVSIVDLNQTPSLPEVFRYTGVPSVWRDLKTFGNYAYITHDQTLNPWVMKPQGLLIIDLDSVEFGKTPKWYRRKIAIPQLSGNFDTLKTAHNLYIDENGVCYIFGADVGLGGAIMLDITTDPINPSFIGIYNEVYLHDGMVRGDTLWGSAVFNGDFKVIDVSNKAAPVTIGAKTTSSQFTHNAWISDNNKVLFTTDEVNAAFIGSYDVSDMGNIQELDLINSSLSSQAIPHNTHVYGDFLVSSYYTSGVQVVDASEPDILVEVGYYDTSPSFSGTGFNGAWGAFPYLPSERILVTDMEEGLKVLSTEYPRASFWRGTIVDLSSNNTIAAAQITESNGLFSGTSNINGDFKWGGLTNGISNLSVSASGYNTANASIQLSPGLVNRDTIFLSPLGFSLIEKAQAKVLIYPNPSHNTFEIDFPTLEMGRIEIVDISGRVLHQFERGLEKKIQLSLNLKPGAYILQYFSEYNNSFQRRIQIL